MIETVRVAGGKEHATYAGVLAEAHKKGLKGISVRILQYPTDENHFMCICEATITMSIKESMAHKDGMITGGIDGTFVEIGDASPKNVNSMIAPHLVRMAATRAKGRALRDAVNIGKALKEEFGN